MTSSQRNVLFWVLLIAATWVSISSGGTVGQLVGGGVGKVVGELLAAGACIGAAFYVLARMSK